ncbi:MAG: C40 family peptidase [Proteobacteria bacterium]|nr:C40 family peptidase [Pseudomonadota bacterium]
MTAEGLIPTIKHRYAQLLLIALLLAVIFGCAPQQVKVYQPVAGVRNDIVQHTVALLGKPYKNAAKGPDAFDCSGLVYYVYKKVNIVLPVMTEGLIKAGYDVARDSVLPGDLVFFKIKKNLHSGIMINKTDFVHSSNSRGVTVDSIESKYWQKSFFCFRSVL